MDVDAAPIVDGLLLAAGAGRRMGGPKALLRDPDGTPWVTRSAQVLAEGGCRRVIVVVGAAAEQVAALVPQSMSAVAAVDWAEGMGASLRAGLAALGPQTRAAVDPAVMGDGPAPADAVLVGLVDTPGVTAAVVARMLAEAGPHVLGRASYGGTPGHPVLIGRGHWTAAALAAHGDTGARGYLAGRDDVRLIECGDLGHGQDHDTPGGLPDVPLAEVPAASPVRPA